MLTDFSISSLSAQYLSTAMNSVLIKQKAIFCLLLNNVWCTRS